MWNRFGALATVLALFLAASLVTDEPILGIKHVRLFLVSAGFAITAGDSLRTGSAWSKFGNIRKDRSPILYWFSVMLFAGLALVFLFAGIHGALH